MKDKLKKEVSSMTRYQAIEITNMIMIENQDTGEILVEDRQNPKWPG